MINRAPVERALEAARVSHSIQRDQCIVIRHMPSRQRDPDAVMLHEQEIVDLREVVRHAIRRAE